jgi:hypothetical protein
MKKNAVLTLFSLLIAFGFVFVFVSEPALTGMAAKGVEIEDFDNFLMGGQLIGLALVIVGAVGFYISLKKTERRWN